jgi:hypothetical protein
VSKRSLPALPPAKSEPIVTETLEKVQIVVESKRSLQALPLAQIGNLLRSKL